MTNTQDIKDIKVGDTVEIVDLLLCDVKRGYKLGDTLTVHKIFPTSIYDHNNHQWDTKQIKLIRECKGTVETKESILKKIKSLQEQLEQLEQDNFEDRLRNKVNLLVDMEKWVKDTYPDWKPDWEDSLQKKYGIDGICKLSLRGAVNNFVFGVSAPNLPAAQQMLDVFKDRIKEYY